MVAQQGGAEVAPNCCCCCCCGARHLLRYFCPIVAVVAVPIEFLRDEITSTPSISISATFQIYIQLLYFARFNIPHSWGLELVFTQDQSCFVDIDRKIGFAQIVIAFSSVTEHKNQIQVLWYIDYTD